MLKRILALLMCAALMLPAGAAAQEMENRVLEDSFSYEGENIRITVEQYACTYKKDDLRYFVVHVYTERPDQLKTAFAGEEYSKTAAEATSEIGARHGAVIAINGDYYNYKDNVGLVIRNGVLYRDCKSVRDQLLISKDGEFIALPEGEYVQGTGQSYVDAGMEQCFTFGPLLVLDGQATQLPRDYMIATDDGTLQPRTAIGQVGENHYVILIADGRRRKWSEKGMNMTQMQQILVEEGCQIAYNLDGGGSTTLIINGELINKPSGSRERNVSDIIYFTE